MSDSKYAFEKSKIIQGCALEKLQLIPDNSIDYVCSDLPYGKTKNKWDVIIDPDKLWEQVWRITKPNAAIKFFGQDKFTAMMMLSTKWHRYNLIWDIGDRGSGFLNAKRMPLRNHEDMMVFYKKLPTYNPQLKEGKPLHGMGSKFKNGKLANNNYGEFDSSKNPSANRAGDKMKQPKSIWRYNKPHPAIYPTEKPVALIEESVMTYSNEGETVLDLCSGSGTLAEACINTNRDFIIIDKNPIAYEIGKERVGKIFKNYGLDLQPLLNERM